MSYSDKARTFLRNKKVIIPQDNEQFMFDSFSQSWKKIAVFNNQGTISTNENGLVEIQYPDNFDYEQDAMAVAILLTTVDSDGQTINWNIRNNETDINGAIPSTENPGLVTLRGNRITISPANVIRRNSAGRPISSSIGLVQHIGVYTDDSPNFTSFSPLTYQTVDGRLGGGTHNWQFGSGYRNRTGRFEFGINYSHDVVTINDFNTSKIFDLIQFGTAKTFFATTPQGSRSNIDNTQGVLLIKDTGITPNGGRLYQLENSRITFYSNPDPGTSISALHTTNNRLGRYEFHTADVASAKGIAIDSNGSKTFILSTSATTHPAKTIVEYDVDTPYDITTMKSRKSYYNDTKIGSKTQLRDNGKYLYSLRYDDYSTGGNTATTGSGGYGGSNSSHATLGDRFRIGTGGHDWPLKAYIYRYDLEKDYTSTEAGTIYTTPFACDKTLNASFYDYHKTYLNTATSYSERTFGGPSAPFGHPYYYFTHRGPVVGFDMTDGNNLYLVTTKAFNRGHVVHLALGTQWDPTSETGENYIVHNIGSQSGNKYFQANFKTNGVWDIKVNNDGTSIYLLDTDTFAIYQYDMTSPNDLTTLNRTELAPISKTIDTNGYDKVLFLSGNIPATGSVPPRTFAQEVADGINIPGTNSASRQNATQPNFFRDFSMVRSFNFNNDGSRVYINNDHRIYQYNLSTAFDISTALFVGSTEKYRVHMEGKHEHIGVGHYIDSNNRKFYIGNEKYELNQENQGVVREFNLVDSVGSGSEPFLEKIHVLDSDNWQDIHLNDSGNRLYVSGPNKIKRLNLNSAGIISSVSIESNYTWDSADKFSGASITSNPTETDFYVADSSKTIRMVTLGSGGSIASVGKSYTATAPSTENTVIRGMSWFEPTNFILGGNNRIDHFKSKDSFQVADI